MRDDGSCLRNVEVGWFLVGWSLALSPEWVAASVVGSRGVVAGSDALFCGAKIEVFGVVYVGCGVGRRDGGWFHVGAWVWFPWEVHCGQWIFFRCLP